MGERSRWILPAAAGAAALAVVGGVVAVVAVRGSDGGTSPPAASPSTSSGLGDEVVRDGDRVRGRGTVVALPGRPVRLCLGASAGSGNGSAAGVGSGDARTSPTRMPDYCTLGVTLRGADLDRLANRQERDGAVWGYGEVTGSYRDRTVTVTGQRVPPATDVEQTVTLPRLPADCPAPAGGWPRGEVQALPGIDAVSRYVAAQPDVLGSVSIVYPERTRPGAIGPQVLLVGTTGDVAAATRQVRRSYAGPLCVRSVPHSRAQMLAAHAKLTAAMTDPDRRDRYGLLGGGQHVVDGDPRTSIWVVVYDEQVRALRESAGAALVDVEPALRKLA